MGERDREGRRKGGKERENENRMGVAQDLSVLAYFHLISCHYSPPPLLCVSYYTSFHPILLHLLFPLFGTLSPKIFLSAVRLVVGLAYAGVREEWGLRETNEGDVEVTIHNSSVQVGEEMVKKGKTVY